MRIIAFITFSADIQRYWITSKSRRKLPASPRHAGHRCGTTVVCRRWVRVWRLSQIVIWQTNHRQITPTISALLGEFAAMGNGPQRPRLRRGRVVFFGSPAHHVGIYAGGGMMYDSPHTGDVTRYRKIYSSSVTYGRY